MAIINLPDRLFRCSACTVLSDNRRHRALQPRRSLSLNTRNSPVSLQQRFALASEDPTFPNESHWYCLTVRRPYLPRWVTLILSDSQKKTIPSQMCHTDTVWQSEEDPTFPDESHWYRLTVRRRPYLPKWVTLTLHFERFISWQRTHNSPYIDAEITKIGSLVLL